LIKLVLNRLANLTAASTKRPVRSPKVSLTKTTPLALPSLVVVLVIVLTTETPLTQSQKLVKLKSKVSAKNLKTTSLKSLHGLLNKRLVSMHKKVELMLSSLTSANKLIQTLSQLSVIPLNQGSLILRPVELTTTQLLKTLVHLRLSLHLALVQFNSRPLLALLSRVLLIPARKWLLV
jgi:hypothetical protein